MTSTVGTEVLDDLLLDFGLQELLPYVRQVYTNFHGDKKCERGIEDRNLFILFENKKFRLIGIREDHSYWGIMGDDEEEMNDTVLVVDERIFSFIEEDSSILVKHGLL